MASLYIPKCIRALRTAKSLAVLLLKKHFSYKQKTFSIKNKTISANTNPIVQDMETPTPKKVLNSCFTANKIKNENENAIV